MGREKGARLFLNQAFQNCGALVREGMHSI